MSYKFYNQKKNIGFDLNYLFCLKKATARYVHIIGDDDCVSLDYFEKILKVLNSKTSYSLIGLNSFGFNNNFYEEIPFTFKKDKPSYGEISFLKSINISITFISSLILNKSLINNFSMANQYKGSHVIHLFFIFYLLSLPKKNYFVQSFLVGSNRQNNIYVDPFEILIKNFKLILDTSKLKQKEEFYLIYKKMFAMNFLPEYLFLFIRTNPKKIANIQKKTFKYYQPNLRNILFLFPIFYLHKYKFVAYWLIFVNKLVIKKDIFFLVQLLLNKVKYILKNQMKISD